MTNDQIPNLSQIVTMMGRVLHRDPAFGAWNLELGISLDIGFWELVFLAQKTSPAAITM
jgi:hypothetical protein